MVLNVITPDPLITCPLDESHRILKSRMQFHLVRCLKNHKLDNKMKCPWNPLHIIDKFTYEDHWRNKCEDLPDAMESVVNGFQDADRSNIHIVPSSVTDAKLPPMEEDWDAEPHCGSYDPVKNSEGKPVLRSAIGLSKARKKEWHRQERLRHQQLEDVLPMQIRSIPKPNITKDSCRTPHNPGIAMSANASVTDELNATRISMDEIEISKLPTNLRAPYAPSLGMTYTPDDTYSCCSRDQTRSLFDETFGFENEHTYGSSSYCLANAMKGLEHRRIDSDARSCVSNASNSSRIASLRKYLDLTVDVPKKSYSTVASSGTVERPKIQLQNEAACLPLINPTCVKKSTAVADDIVNELTQLLANLDNKEKKIQEEKAALLAQFSQHTPKSMNLKSNESNGENRNHLAPTKDKEAPLLKTQIGLPNEMPKCAANFAKFKKFENPPTIGAGRGRVMNFDLLKNRKPGTNSTKENTDPFA